MKKMRIAFTISVMTLLIGACTIQNNQTCCSNGNSNKVSVSRTHLYNSQVPVKSQNSNVKYPNLNVTCPQ